MSEISRDQWLKALGNAATPPEDGAMTVQELCALFDISRERAYRRILKLIAEGKARRAYKYIEAGRGRIRVAAYVLTETPTRATRPAARRR